MADSAELAKLNDTLEYFKRYFEFDDAVAVNKENREYLKTYIHAKDFVAEQYGMKKKKKQILVASIIAGAAGLAIPVLAMGFEQFEIKNIIVGVICAAVAFLAVFVSAGIVLSKKFKKVWLDQDEINKGINEQIEALNKRGADLEKQKNDYLDALEKKQLAVIPIKYMKYAEEIAGYVREDKVETVKQAVSMFEQNLLMQKITQLQERKRKKVAPTAEVKTQQVGNPLAMFKSRNK